MKNKLSHSGKDQMELMYRSDIDGLRAIAVIAVIFYHADIKFFSGGFVGVDIFFVISGYLITTIILREIDKNEFSLVKFYERRVRRIFPALFTVIIASLFISTVLFDAHEFLEFGKSLVASTLFASNILFWNQSGYFDAPSELKPLLHTWSLAVEEQYYIFFPLLLVFLARYSRPRLLLILFGITMASFALNVYNLKHDVSGAFYLAHMRIWELLIGSLLTIKIRPVKTNLYINNLLSVIGLVLIALPIFLYTNDTPFPGIAAVMPAAGTALIIYAGFESETFIGRILSFSPIVFIGKISYSLYLWHWPMIIFARYYAIRGLSVGETAGVLLSIFIVSILSWLFIEKPFRKRIFYKKHQLFAYAGVVMLLMTTIGSIIYLNNGFPGRFSSQQASVDLQWENWGKCNLDEKYQISPLPLCSIGKDKGTPIFLLWGDSHARALAPSIQISASQTEITGLTAYTNGCSPLLGIDRQGYPLPCNEINEVVLNYIHDHPDLDTIILASM